MADKAWMDMKEMLKDSDGIVHQYAQEVADGHRFRFGDNWWYFLGTVNDERIEESVKSLMKMLDIDDLAGKTFLDIGSGSGLFSLAARKLGAKVHSFDFDPKSVACTHELKRRYMENDDDWRIEEGSVLDTGYIRSLGLFDVVYSWGVLHHTGNMWNAIDNAISLVKPEGLLFVALYNDEGWISKYWRIIKFVHNRVPWMQWPLRVLYAPYFVGLGWIILISQ